MPRKDVSDLLVCLAHYIRNHYRDLPDKQTLIVPLAKNYTEDWLMYWTGEHFNIVFRALERTCAHGLIDYGTWVRGAWLSAAGSNLLWAELGIEAEPMCTCGCPARCHDASGDFYAKCLRCECEWYRNPKMDAKAVTE